MTGRLTILTFSPQQSQHALRKVSAGRRGSGGLGILSGQRPSSTSCSAAQHTRQRLQVDRTLQPCVQCVPSEQRTGTADHADRCRLNRSRHASTLCGHQLRHDGLVDVNTPMFRPQGSQAQRSRHLCRSASSPIHGAAASVLGDSLAGHGYLPGSDSDLVKEYLQPAATLALALAIFSVPMALSQDFKPAKGLYQKIGGQGADREPVRVFVMNPECLLN